MDPPIPIAETGREILLKHGEAALPLETLVILNIYVMEGGEHLVVGCLLDGLSLFSHLYWKEGELPFTHEDHETGVAAILYQLTGALYHKGTEIREVAYDDKVRRARERQGKPSYDYNVIEVLPPRQRRAYLGGTHDSPKMHWRRGHIRRLPNGQETPVRPCLVGDITKGFVFKDYVVT